MSSATLFTRAKNWKDPSVHRSANGQACVVFTHSGAKGILTGATERRKLEDILPGQAGHRRTVPYSSTSMRSLEPSDS